MFSILLIYFLIILAVVFYSYKTTTKSEFYSGGHNIGPFTLLLTLFATNMTAITLIGVPNQSFSSGFMVFLTMGLSTAFIVPVMFKMMGTRACEQSVKLGLLTQGELIFHKTDSRGAARLFSVLSLVFLVPYIIIGLKGGGDVLSLLVFEAYQFDLPVSISTAMIAMLIIGYVALGGITATSRVNVLQAVIFIVGSLYITSALFERHGGVILAMETLLADKPDLFSVPFNATTVWQAVSLYMIALSVGAFPHIFNHWCSAKNSNTFKASIRLYPVCIIGLWLSCSLIGMLSNLEFSQQPEGPVVIALLSVLNSEIVSGVIAVSILGAFAGWLMKSEGLQQK